MATIESTNTMTFECCFRCWCLTESRNLSAIFKANSSAVREDAIPTGSDNKYVHNGEQITAPAPAAPGFGDAEPSVKTWVTSASNSFTNCR